MSGCGNAWCTVKHTATKRRQATCESTVWIHRYRPLPIKMSIIPFGASGSRDDASVVVDLFGQRGGWYSVSPSPGFDRVSSWLTPEETRVMGRALIAAADAADQMHDLEVAQRDAQDLDSGPGTCPGE